MGLAAQHNAVLKPRTKTVSDVPPIATSQRSGQRSNTAETVVNTRRGATLLVWLFAFTLAVILIAGWANRNDTNLSADEGLGYTLGLVGGIMMLLMFLYPLRKRVRILRHLGGVKYWFQIHMLMGVLAPILMMSQYSV